MSFELIMIYAALMWEGAEPDTLILYKYKYKYKYKYNIIKDGLTI